MSKEAFITCMEGLRARQQCGRMGFSGFVMIVQPLKQCVESRQGPTLDKSDGRAGTDQHTIIEAHKKREVTFRHN